MDEYGNSCLKGKYCISLSHCDVLFWLQITSYGRLECHLLYCFLCCSHTRFTSNTADKTQQWPQLKVWNDRRDSNMLQLLFDKVVFYNKICSPSDKCPSCCHCCSCFICIVFWVKLCQSDISCLSFCLCSKQILLFELT